MTIKSEPIATAPLIALMAVVSRRRRRERLGLTSRCPPQPLVRRGHTVGYSSPIPPLLPPASLSLYFRVRAPWQSRKGGCWADQDPALLHPNCKLVPLPPPRQRARPPARRPHDRRRTRVGRHERQTLLQRWGCTPLSALKCLRADDDLCRWRGRTRRIGRPVGALLSIARRASAALGALLVAMLTRCAVRQCRGGLWPKQRGTARVRSVLTPHVGRTRDPAIATAPPMSGCGKRRAGA
jgi:hypothetical protein